VKKKSFKVIAIIMALVGILGLTACTKPLPGNTKTDEIVEYYGCPNSKRVRKLRLIKK